MSSLKRKFSGQKLASGSSSNEGIPEFIIDEDEDEEESAINVHGEVRINGKCVGTLSCQLLARGRGFYMACDEVSSDTQEIAVLFFEDNGKLQSNFARQLPTPCNSGGFLYFSSVEVDEDYRGNNLGLMLVQKVLDSLNGRFSIAMIKPWPLKSTGEEADTQAIVALSRYYSRLGFVQGDKTGKSSRTNFWYLTADSYTGEIRTKESAQNTPVAKVVPAPVVSEVNKEIRGLIVEAPDSLYASMGGPSVFNASKFKDSISAVIARGGDLNEAGALHVAVANSMSHLLQPLIELGSSIY